MEILKLLRANIKYKKGAFKSIIVLMAIITLSFAVTISNNDNIDKAADSANAYADSPDFFAFQIDDVKDPDIIDKILENPDVADAVETKCVSVAGEINNIYIYQVSFVYPDSHRIYQVFNENNTAYVEKPEPLKKGEIYLPYSFTGLYSGLQIGTEVRIGEKNNQRVFKVKGFIAEPALGAASIGTKRFFVSTADFEEMYADADGKNISRAWDISVNLAEGADYLKVKKALDDSCGIARNSVLTISLEELEYYTKLIAETGTGILSVFVILLVAIAIISMWHSITTSIEMEYTNLGILKALGFTPGKIRIIYILQYIIAETTGAVIGLLLSVPLTVIFGSLFQPITGLLTATDVSFFKCGIIALGILVLCAVFVVIATSRVSRISPVRAISGGKSEVHFDNRLNIPIKAKPLSFFVGLRHFTSRSKSYIGSVLIVSLLVYFMMSIIVLSDRLSSKNIMENTINSDVAFSVSDSFEVSDIKKLEEKTAEIDENAKVLFENYKYVMIDGIELQCLSYSRPEYIFKPYDGRLPVYDNEVALTEISSDMLGKEIGDTVMIGSGSDAAEFIVTGIHQSLNDIGKNFLITTAGFYKIEGKFPVGYIELSDKSIVDTAAEMLTKDFGDKIKKIKVLQSNNDSSSTNGTMDMVDSLCGILVIVVFAVSIIFSLVVINMICAKSFIKERTDIGIFKALGFTPQDLRTQFAFRFLIIAVIGSLLGGLASLFFTVPLLEMLLRMVGLAKIDASFDFLTFALPALAACVSFFLFSYIAARKIKKVEVRELISE